MRPATLALLFCYLFISLVHFLYYPKWQQEGAEATISYDVSGYYLYLPAAFIYQDLRQVAFLEDIIETYRPTADPYQVFTHESGNRVMKYSVGQAVMYAPFFALGHAWALASDTYPPDGFSRPYQLLISLGSLIVSFLGLFWLCTVLRHYFAEKTVAITLLLLVLGTNYLNYSAIDGAMTHNNVFTLYALLLLSTHRFYERPGLGWALLIGACLGLMALTRPTEIIAALIPLLWGLDFLQRSAWQNRAIFFRTHAGKLLAAAAVTLLIGSLQLMYWKYVSGDWLVYSYQDQGFDWLRPHLNQGLFSYKAGWLIYTPLMVFGLLGFYPLWRQRPALSFGLLLQTLIFIYVAFSWSVWWYGGSLGQRTMVQAYAVLAFPLAAFVASAFRPPSVDRTLVRRKHEQARPQVPGQDEEARQPWAWWRYLLAGIVLLFVWHNLYFTHQAHRGGLYLTEQMNNAYFWRTLYKFSKDPEDQLRLDTPEFYTRQPAGTRTLYTNDFEDRSTENCGLDPITGKGSLCLIAKEQNSPSFVVDISEPPGTWIRASINAKVNAHRGNRDNHAQMILAYQKDGVEVKKRLIRMHRLLNHDWRRQVHMEAKVPDVGADKIIVSFWNGGNSQPALILDDLVIEVLEN